MSARATIRRAWRTSIVGAALAMFAIVMPTTASAVVYPCSYAMTAAASNAAPGCWQQPLLVHPWAGFQGWGQVKTYYCQPTGAPCPAMATIAYVPAWRWNGSWTPASLRNDEQVYVYPYAVGWSWVWTARTGWLAAADRYVYVSAPAPLTAYAP